VKLTLKFASLCLLLPISSFATTVWSRQVGPEAGLQFGVPPSGVSMCAFGDYVRALNSAFGGDCPTLIKFVDDFVTHWNDLMPTYIPASDAKNYFVPVNYKGRIYNGRIPYTTYLDYGYDIARPAFQDYIFSYYVPQLFLPHGPNEKNGIPSDAKHPTYLSADGYSTNYNFYGVWINGTFTSNVTWEPAYPQNSTEWFNGWKAFYAYAKAHAPAIRLSPHIGSMSDPGWDKFQALYADCPALMREPYFLSSLSAPADFLYKQIYNQLLNLYWFANVAPPVFSTSVNPSEPRTRVVQWGTWVDNGDVQTALAVYTMVRGPNTFFDLLHHTPQVAVNPSQWLPIVRKIGAGTSAPTVIATASGKSASSGYNLLRRTWQHGISYLNLSGSTRVIHLPLGSKDWHGNSISSITLGLGKGYVVLLN
jgi:hypothetical protein